MVVVMVSVCVGSVYLGAVVVARHRVQAAADLAALAAASQVPGGAAAACASAGDVVRAMRLDSITCTVEDLDVVVTVSATVGHWGSAHAAARAGPG